MHDTIVRQYYEKQNGEAQKVFLNDRKYPHTEAVREIHRDRKPDNAADGKAEDKRHERRAKKARREHEDLLRDQLKRHEYHPYKYMEDKNVLCDTKRMFKMVKLQERHPKLMKQKSAYEVTNRSANDRESTCDSEIGSPTLWVREHERREINLWRYRKEDRVSNRTHRKPKNCMRSLRQHYKALPLPVFPRMKALKHN